MRMGVNVVNSPIIVFNPSGLTEEQVKQVKQALDDAYRAGYETAKEFYQLKLNTVPSPNMPNWITAPNQYQINNASHGIEQGIYPTANSINCNHSYVNAENKAKGIFCLPLYPEMTNAEVLRVCDTLKDIMIKFRL